MENSSGFRRGKHSPAPKPRLEALATSPLSFLHHPTTTMADHAPLVNFLSRLNTDVGAGTDKEFLAATGRRLAAAHILPEECGVSANGIWPLTAPRGLM